VEILRRTWHVDGRSVRPDHRMVAHTGFPDLGATTRGPPRGLADHPANSTQLSLGRRVRRVLLKFALGEVPPRAKTQSSAKGEEEDDRGRDGAHRRDASDPTTVATPPRPGGTPPGRRPPAQTSRRHLTRVPPERPSRGKRPITEPMRPPMKSEPSTSSKIASMKLPPPGERQVVHGNPEHPRHQGHGSASTRWR
jgi:hypothetical protein